MPDDLSLDHAILTDDGNPHTNDDEYEYMQQLDMPMWMMQL